MDHNQAIEEMSVERYLLGELSPDARDQFEEHMFECTECAMDVRAGDVFVQAATAQLRSAPFEHPAATPLRKPEKPRTDWFAWLRPSFAVPAFAALLVCIGYQNLVTIPGLRTEAVTPRIGAIAPLLHATRGASQPLAADRDHGLVVPVELPTEPAMTAYASYALDLYRPDGKLAWTGTVAAPRDGAEELPVSLVLPGASLQSGTYALAITGVGDHGERALLERLPFQVAVTH